MKKIKVKAVDFYDNFDYRTNVIFNILKQHYELDFSDDPDYLIYSVFGQENLKYDCIKIFYTGENLMPDFNLCDYAIGFDYLEYGDRYFRCPLYFSEHYSNVRNLMMTKHKNVNKELLKRKFCSFVYSNTKASEIRDLLYYKISEYKPIESGGLHLNNIGGRVNDKLKFESEHKFSIACENSQHPGYSTEKIVEAFAARTVPIYWGDPEIKKIFNPKSFICVSDFNDFDRLIYEIERIDNDDHLYLEMLKCPALNNPNYIIETFNNLEDFIINIIEQDKETAYRRNRKFWGEIYLEERRIWNKVYDRSLTKLIRRITNILYFKFKKYFDW